MAGKPEQLYVTTRDKWRAWLKTNHDVKSEIWLVYYKKHTGKPRIPYDDAVEEALCYGWIDSIVRRLDEQKYMQKFTPRKDKSIWSEANKKRVNRMIRQKRMTESGHAKVRAAKKSGEWARKQSNEDFREIPADLKKALSADRRAKKNFENLAPSYRKNFIGWVLSAKKDDTRARRIREVVRLAREKEKK